MFTDEERKFANEATPNFNRGQHLREAFAVLGLLPIIGFLFANHSWVFILVFLLFVNGIAFGLRFLTQPNPDLGLLPYLDGRSVFDWLRIPLADVTQLSAKLLSAEWL